MGQVSVRKCWMCLLASVVRSAQIVTYWHVCPPQCPFPAGSFCTSTPWQTRGLAHGQQVPDLYWRLVAVWCKSEGCVASGHSQGILVQISGIFMMLLEFWQDVVLHEPFQCKSSVRKEWNLISQHISSLVSGSTACQCILWSNRCLPWACWTQFQLDFVLLFPLIHLKNNQQIFFCKLP